MSSEIKETACIGVGLIGCCWALDFARAGCGVALYSRSGAGAAAMVKIGDKIDNMIAAGVDLDRDTILERVRIADTIDDAVANADWVQESIIESRAEKADLWARFSSVKPHAIIASSTSAIPASTFMTGHPWSPRSLVVHPPLPQHILPFLEVCPTPQTDPACVAEAAAFVRSIGHKAAVMNKEIEGYIINRFQRLVVEEAFALVAGGYCSFEDVELSLLYALGPRWSVSGAFESAHLALPNGFRDVAVYLKESGKEDMVDTPVFKEVLAKLEETNPPADLDARRAWRERALLKLLQTRDAAFSETSDTD